MSLALKRRSFVYRRRKYIGEIGRSTQRASGAPPRALRQRGARSIRRAQRRLIPQQMIQRVSLADRAARLLSRAQMLARCPLQQGARFLLVAERSEKEARKPLLPPSLACTISEKKPVQTAGVAMNC